MLGFIFLGLAMLIIMAGCAGMMFLFLKMTQRRTAEPYFQFEDENRLPQIGALSQVQEDPEGEAAGAESTVEKSREASAEMKKELGFPAPNGGSR